ncbi:hypothetical protein GF386_01590 [Candidatus Pacearchaeota archaeon]|nr:hypothetical protein [Candidatus Pacearchaeota archaeon]MBD3282873.1 hypothetical protein [Candidatus Pacearchaeota archaeon]
MSYVSYNQNWFRVLDEAAETARFLGYEEVTPGCILMGLLRTDLSGILLRDEGITPCKVLGVFPEIEGAVRDRIAHRYDMPYTHSAVNIVNLAKKSGEEMQHGYRGPEHLIIGIGRSEDSDVREIFDMLGISGQQLVDSSRNLLGFGIHSAA